MAQTRPGECFDNWPSISKDLGTETRVGISPRLTKALNIAYDVGLHEDRAIWIGTAHLLLGLAEERDGLAGRILVRAGATPERIRERMSSGQLQSG